MYNLYNDEDIVISGKRDKQSDNENDAEIEQEIERDFEVAESLASEESDPVSIFDTDKQNKNGTVVKHDNLFTKYQFYFRYLVRNHHFRIFIGYFVQCFELAF